MSFAYWMTRLIIVNEMCLFGARLTETPQQQWCCRPMPRRLRSDCRDSEVVSHVIPMFPTTKKDGTSNMTKIFSELQAAIVLGVPQAASQMDASPPESADCHSTIALTGTFI